MSGLRGYLRHTGWPVAAAMLALMAFGVLAIHAAERADSSLRVLAARQIVYCVLGLVAFGVFAAVPYARFGRAAYPLFAVSLGLLVLVFFLPAVRNSHRWIDLKVVRVQPSELAKLSFVLMLAWYLRYRENYRRLSGLLVPLALTLVPMLLVLREPDLGTSLLFLPGLFFMLFLAGAKWRHLLAALGVAAALILLPVPRAVPDAGEDAARRRSLAYGSVHVGGREYVLTAAPLAVMQPHQVRRIDGWLHQSDPRVAADEGYQLRQAKMILGSGRWTGQGDWSDADACLRMLPDDHTDFVFSVIGGQWGFAGAAAVLALYAVIFLCGLEIATATYDPFARLLAGGVLAILFAQVLINVGMSLGLMPITGMTLPLVSYGGSSLLTNCAALGLLVNVGARRPILLAKRPFEFGQKEEKPPAPYGPLGAAGQWPRWRRRLGAPHYNKGA